MVTLGTNLPGGGTGRGADRGDWFAALAASPRPAVVDHGRGGDRVELSGRVLANWGAKTANLVDAEGHGPDASVLVDLPVDWTSLAVLLGLARAGVHVVFAGTRDRTDPAGHADRAGRDADLILTDAPGDWAEHPADLWVVDSGAGTHATGHADADSAAVSGAGTGAAQAPAHALVFLGEVRIQADQCHLPLPGDPRGLPGLAGAWADLAAPDDAGTGPGRWSRRERGLVVAAEDARLDRSVMSAAAEAWERGVPVVLVPEHAMPFSTEAARRVEAEGVGGPA